MNKLKKISFGEKQKQSHREDVVVAIEMAVMKIEIKNHFISQQIERKCDLKKKMMMMMIYSHCINEEKTFMPGNCVEQF